MTWQQVINQINDNPMFGAGFKRIPLTLQQWDMLVVSKPLVYDTIDMIASSVVQYN